MARTEVRVEAQKHTVATLLGHPDVNMSCEIRDVSRSGMCIFVGTEVPLGRVMKVEWGAHFLVGRAQRVTPRGTGYEVGLELLYCSKWEDPMASALTAVNNC